MYSQSNPHFFDLQSFKSKGISNFFIDLNFIEVKHEKVDLIGKNHSLGLYNFNREARIAFSNLEFFNLKISDVYLYLSADKYCLYLSADFNSSTISTLFKSLGQAQNVQSDQLDLNDFDFLDWRIDALSIHLLKDRTTNSKKCLVLIYNGFTFNDLINKTRIF